MKISIRWGTVCFFSLMLAMAACGSDDAEPTPSDNTGGSGGSAGSSDDAGADPDANDDGDDPDAGDEPDGGEDPDGGDKPDGGGEDLCTVCVEDPVAGCGSELEACLSNQTCKDAFKTVQVCGEAAPNDDEIEKCLDQFMQDGGQPAQELWACMNTKCGDKCEL